MKVNVYLLDIKCFSITAWYFSQYACLVKYFWTSLLDPLPFLLEINHHLFLSKYKLISKSIEYRLIHACLLLEEPCFKPFCLVLIMMKLDGVREQLFRFQLSSHPLPNFLVEYAVGSPMEFTVCVSKIRFVSGGVGGDSSSQLHGLG